MATRKPPAKKRGATSSRRQPTSRTRREWRLPGWLWGLTGLVAGFLLSQHQHGVAPWQDEDSPLARVLPRSAPPPGEPAPAAEPEAPAMPTFEFYTLLPESEVIAPGGEMPASTATPPPPEAPEAEGSNSERAPDADPIAQVIAANLSKDRQANDRQAQAEAADTRATPATTASGQRFMLQAASFREPGDAQQLRSRLRDFGLLAQVSEVKASGNQTWHRVQVGPYQDRRELSRARDLMVTQGIEPLLIQLND
ncbi:SPOR domain-containing protein [Halomonas sp.]|uniref:SPOR domain-containing protein n=1 Tax=Halomonas sp. TaxID=1486246 RepID=UPI003D110988